MGKRISGKKIQQAMAKAFDLGIEEEPLNINGIVMVVQNLPQPEWQAAVLETQELEDDDAIIDQVRFSLLSRSIIELEGVSFRGVTSIETEDEDDKGQPIVLEKKDYLDQILKTWTGEVLQIVYGKFLEVTRVAEEKAKKNVVFRPSDDSPQEEMRNLLIRAKEIQGELPFELAEKILQDTGFREVKLTVQETAPEPPKQETPPPEPEAKSSPVEPVEPRVPVTVSQKPTIPFTGAPPGVPPIPPHVLERQRQLAELEALAGGFSAPPSVQSPPVQLDLVESEVPELVEHAVKPNFAEALSAPQQRGGINPRFKQRV